MVFFLYLICPASLQGPLDPYFIERMRLREVKWPASGHTARRTWWS